MAERIDALMPPVHSDLFGVYEPVIAEQALPFPVKGALDRSQKTLVDHNPLGKVMATFGEITLKRLCLRRL